MLEPRGWHVKCTDEFEDDYNRLLPGAKRLDAHRRSWIFILERRPWEYAKALIAHDDGDQRVIVNPEPLEDAEYVVGVTIDRAAQTVWLRWLDRRELT